MKVAGSSPAVQPDQAPLERRADVFVEIVLVGGPRALPVRLEEQVRALIAQRRTRIS